MNSHARSIRVAVVGAGISGLAAAHAMRTAAPHADVLLLEGTGHIGGKLRLDEVAGVAVDQGAEALLARRPEGIDLATAVAVSDQLEPAATTTARIYARGALRPFPAGHLLGVPSDVASVRHSGLLSGPELARLAADLVVPRAGLPGEQADQLAVGPFLARRLGRGVVDRLIEPLLGGVYAGRADGLSLAATLPQLVPELAHGGSVMRAAQRARARATPATGPVFMSVRGGLGRLPDAVAAASGAQLRTGVTVRELRRTPTGWELTCGPASSAAAAEVVSADAVVVAVPGAPASRLLAPIVPAAAAALASLEYASVAIVTLALRRTDLSEHVLATLAGGSGFLVASDERRLVKGVTVLSTKWGHYAEAAPDLVLLRASVGRHQDEATLQRSDDELLTLVRRDVQAMIGPLPLAIDARVTRWGGALPQYAPGHLGRVQLIRTALDADPSFATLAVCGAAYDGVGVPACIASGQAAAARVLAGLAARPVAGLAAPGTMDV